MPISSSFGWEKKASNCRFAWIEISLAAQKFFWFSGPIWKFSQKILYWYDPPFWKQWSSSAGRITCQNIEPNCCWLRRFVGRSRKTRKVEQCGNEQAYILWKKNSGWKFIESGQRWEKKVAVFAYFRIHPLQLALPNIHFDGDRIHRQHGSANSPFPFYHFCARHCFSLSSNKDRVENGIFSTPTTSLLKILPFYWSGCPRVQSTVHTHRFSSSIDHNRILFDFFHCGAMLDPEDSWALWRLHSRCVVHEDGFAQKHNKLPQLE